MALAAATLAQGIVDVENNPTPTAGFSCGTPPIGNSAISQSFIPGDDSLIAVELLLRTGSGYPAGGYSGTTIRILEDSPAGNVLVEATADVPPGLSPGTDVLVRFDFTELTLTPGNTYVITWVTPDSVVLTWAGDNQTDLYPDGTAFHCGGGTWPGGVTDFNFITYGAEPVVKNDTKTGDCATLLADLQDHVDSLDLGRCAAHSLHSTLGAAAHLMKKGRTRMALGVLHAFSMRTAIFMKLGWISQDDGEALLAEAAELRDCIRSGFAKQQKTKKKHGSCGG